MASYTHFEIPASPLAPWYFMTFDALLSVSANTVVFQNSDGAETRLLSAANDFAFDPVTNTLSGNVNEMMRTDVGGVTTYEAVTGLDMTAATFFPGVSAFLEAAFVENDVMQGWSGIDFIAGVAGDDEIHGEEGDDFLNGGDGNDSIHGGAGFDIIQAEAGDDTVSGGEGNDSISGGEGNDTLSGGGGNDFIYDFAGNNTLAGGDGDDSISADGGINHLLGEGGNDSLYTTAGGAVLNGGEGNDSLSVNTFHLESMPVSLIGGGGDDILVNSASSNRNDLLDAGDGDDTLILESYRTSDADIVTLGAGRDTIGFSYGPISIIEHAVITDFAPGTGGDTVDLNAILDTLSGYPGGSPFGASGYLRLVQDGADTLLQIDSDAAGSNGSSFTAILRFQNTDAGLFTIDNFRPDFSPDGSPPVGRTITGTNEADTLNGGAGNDFIDALEGDDIADGSVGDDTLYGRGGFDQLHGGLGNDTLYGGADNDQIYGEAGGDGIFGDAGSDYLIGDDGNDVIEGGEDNDFLNGYNGDDTLIGGPGNDYLSGGGGTDLLLGGEGDDWLSSQWGGDTLDGGEGNDVFITYNWPDDGIGLTLIGGVGNDLFEDVGGGYRADVVDAGDGNDIIDLSSVHTGGVSNITLGAGEDVISFTYPAPLLTESAAVTDFATGQGGDRIDLTQILYSLTSYDGSNPFGASGYMRLVQDGSDALLQIDGDGAASEQSEFVTIFRFLNTVVSSFTEDNFTPTFDPHGTPPPAQMMTGTSGADFLFGDFGDDIISGETGNDTLDGGGGADQLQGGNGDDALFGGFGDDDLSGGNGSDYLNGGVGANTMNGGNGNDVIVGETGVDKLYGGNGNDFFDGGAGDDMLFGGNGVDRLEGGTGDDALTGGNHSDTFVFRAGFGNDTINDFRVAGTNHDILQFDSSLFADANHLFEHSMNTADGVAVTSGADTLLVKGTTIAQLQEHPEDLHFV
jgi:Ca2+-binding RTX toxin-like protein